MKASVYKRMIPPALWISKIAILIIIDTTPIICKVLCPTILYHSIISHKYARKCRVCWLGFATAFLSLEVALGLRAHITKALFLQAS